MLRSLFGSAWLLLAAFAPTAQADVLAGMDALIPSESYAQARELGLAAVDDPKQHAAVVDALFNLVLESPRSFEEAEWSAWRDELQRTRTARDGTNARALATLAAWQADVAWRAREREAATASVAQARELLQQGKGAISPAERAYVLVISAQITGLQGHYDEAAELAATAAEGLRTPHNMLERVRRLRALFFAAMFQDRLGKSELALATTRQGITEAEALGVPNNAFRRRLVGMLSESLLSRGDFAAVRDLMRPELALLRAMPQPAARDMAMTLGHLAEAERQLGDRELALDLYRESAAVAAKDEGLVASGSYAAILGNLGTLAYELAHYEEADAALSSNLGLMEKQFGENSARVVPPLIAAGEVALLRGLLDEAQARFQRALAIIAVELGPEHAEGAPALRGLARVHHLRGDYASAVAMLVGALAQQEASTGLDHPQLLAWRCELADARARSGDRAGAFNEALLVERRRTQLVAAVVPVLGETQALEFKRGLARCSGQLLASAATGNPEQVAQAWGEIAAARGLATRLAAIRLAHAREQLGKAENEQWVKWEKAARDYADGVRAGADGAALHELRRAVDAAVATLADTQALKALRRPPLDQLLQQRPAQAALVAFVAGDDGVATLGSAPARQLYVFVAKPNQPLRLHSLGDLAAADAISERWYRLIRDPRADLADMAEAGTLVRTRLFDPLQLDAPYGRVFMIADGGLHRLNFAALPDGDGYLIERGLRVHMLESEHDLALAAATSQRNGMLLLGAPELARNDAGELGRLRGSCPELGSAFSPLPGAEREVDALVQVSRTAGLDDVIALKGRAATPSALRRSAARAQIIHFATHAFEIGADCAQQAGTVLRGVGLRRDDAGPAANAREALSREAGLVLSGEQGSNGLLLGADVTTLTLDGVGWVVLSACDTGLGQRLVDEGVFGLRRAFRLAGARTVLMSLWPVDDAATSAWMQALYAARLVQKHDTVDAVADASLAVLQARRAQSESVVPFYWAGFVASGDWR